MNELVLVMETITIWSCIVAIILSQKGVKNGKYYYRSPTSMTLHSSRFSMIGLFFCILVTPFLLAWQISCLIVDYRWTINSMRFWWRKRVLPNFSSLVSSIRNDQKPKIKEVNDNGRDYHKTTNGDAR
mgnify:CR=1 FL=1